MKFFLCFILLVFCFFVFSDDCLILRHRLNKIDSFYAECIQQIIDDQGILLQESTGELWVRRPNFFNWHLKFPDEHFLISDGEILWFYHPYIKQVTVNWLNDIIINTPFMLIINDGLFDQIQYNVKKQSEDSFLLTSKNDDQSFRKFIITLTDIGEIKDFTIIFHDGYRFYYQLINQKYYLIDMSIFKFIPPIGVTLDDLRD